MLVAAPIAQRENAPAGCLQPLLDPLKAAVKGLEVPTRGHCRSITTTAHTTPGRTGLQHGAMTAALQHQQHYSSTTAPAALQHGAMTAALQHQQHYSSTMTPLQPSAQ